MKLNKQVSRLFFCVCVSFFVLSSCKSEKPNELSIKTFPDPPPAVSDQNATPPAEDKTQTDTVDTKPEPAANHTSDTPVFKSTIPSDPRDKNQNYMLDSFETAKDQGTDCSEKHHAGCLDGFCDSFIGYQCSTRCTSDDQCISEDYFCRSDGRCAPKKFVTLWSVMKPDTELHFPGGNGDHCNYTIDWGDSTSDSFTDCQPFRAHKYTDKGDYLITVTGIIPQWSCYTDDNGCVSDPDNTVFCNTYCVASHAFLREIKSFGPVLLGNRAFYYAVALKTLSEIDIPDANMTDMSGMFQNNKSFNSPIEYWDVSQVQNMHFMFMNASAFNQPLAKWDTSNVTDMSGMFESAASFNQPLQNWNTSHVTTMKTMFHRASMFNQPIQSWDTSHVTDMAFMFDAAISFNQPLNAWNVSRVRNMSGMFSATHKFNQPLDQWDTSFVDNMSYMFADTLVFNQPLHTWNMHHVFEIQGMFQSTHAFNQPLDAWDTSNIVYMRNAFRSAFVFNQPLNSWNTSNVLDMSCMFREAPVFNQPLDAWNTSNVLDIADMFYYAKAFDQSLASWDLSKVDGRHPTTGIFYKSGLSKKNWNKMKENEGWVKLIPTLGLPKDY